MKNQKFVKPVTPVGEHSRYFFVYRNFGGYVLTLGQTIELPFISFACDLETWEVGQYLGGN